MTKEETQNLQIAIAHVLRTNDLDRTSSFELAAMIIARLELVGQRQRTNRQE